MRRLVLALVCALRGGSACSAGGHGGRRARGDSTGNATAIAPTSATLNGTVNPEGQATTYYFEYGTTSSYGSQTAMTAAGAGSADLKVLGQVTSLASNTTYHYRLVATNASGTTLGSDVSFKTPKPPVPAATTGHAKDITQTSATLAGTVNPEGQATTYVFQYGTSTAYGNQTPAASAGSGTKAVAASAALGGLVANTTYHYRLVATSVNGTTNGHDVSFKTARPPAGITLGAPSATITFGQLTSLSGRVLPPLPSHPTVTLQSAPSAGGPWADAGVASASASNGAYTFSRLVPSANTYYRALSDGATSATVLVSVRFRVGIFVSRLHPPRGSQGPLPRPRRTGTQRSSRARSVAGAARALEHDQAHATPRRRRRPVLLQRPRANRAKRPLPRRGAAGFDPRQGRKRHGPYQGPLTPEARPQSGLLVGLPPLNGGNPDQHCRSRRADADGRAHHGCSPTGRRGCSRSSRRSTPAGASRTASACR